jgi:hypothetical protein
MNIKADWFAKMTKNSGSSQNLIGQSFFLQIYNNNRADYQNKQQSQKNKSNLKKNESKKEPSLI